MVAEPQESLQGAGEAAMQGPTPPGPCGETSLTQPGRCERSGHSAAPIAAVHSPGCDAEHTPFPPAGNSAEHTSSTNTHPALSGQRDCSQGLLARAQGSAAPVENGGHQVLIQADQFLQRAGELHVHVSALQQVRGRQVQAAGASVGKALHIASRSLGCFLPAASSSEQPRVQGCEPHEGSSSPCMCRGGPTAPHVRAAVGQRASPAPLAAGPSPVTQWRSGTA